MWRIELFGGLRAVHEQCELHRFRTQKTAALLAYLAYSGKPQAREVLIELLWPGATVDSGRNNLRIALSALRRQLEPAGAGVSAVITANRSTVSLATGAVVTDVTEFEAAIQAARNTAGNTAQQIELWNSAFNVYSGPLLHGFYETWIPLEEQRLEELFAECVLQLIARLEVAGQFDRALEVARRGARLAPQRPEPRLAVEHLIGLVSGQRLAMTGAVAERQVPNHRHTRPPVSRFDSITFLMIDASQPDLVVGEQQIFLRDAIACQGGVFVTGNENSASIAFPSIQAAMNATIALRRIQAERIPIAQTPPVFRMVLNVGNEIKSKELIQGDVLKESQAILKVARPGQLLCDELTAITIRNLINDRKPHAMHIAEVGTYRLSDTTQPRRLFIIEETK